MTSRLQDPKIVCVYQWHASVDVCVAREGVEGRCDWPPLKIKFKKKMLTLTELVLLTYDNTELR